VFPTQLTNGKEAARMPAGSKPATSSKRKRLTVICADDNGHKDIRFMMNSDDFRLTDARFAADYTIVGEGAYDHRARTLTVDGRAYHVFSDWSLGDPSARAIEDREAGRVMSPLTAPGGNESRVRACAERLVRVGPAWAWPP
jgi:hypothetical protein